MGKLIITGDAIGTAADLDGLDELLAEVAHQIMVEGQTSGEAEEDGVAVTWVLRDQLAVDPRPREQLVVAAQIVAAIDRPVAVADFAVVIFEACDVAPGLTTADIDLNGGRKAALVAARDRLNALIEAA